MKFNLLIPTAMMLSKASVIKLWLELYGPSTKRVKTLHHLNASLEKNTKMGLKVLSKMPNKRVKTRKIKSPISKKELK